MTDREKVIMGLERCIEKLNTVTNKTHGFNCTACPYFKRCDSSGYLLGLPLMKDALALLKAQEPRVMTLEEVKQFVFGAPYIIETNEPDNESRMMYGLYSHQGLEGNFDFAVTDMLKRLFDIDYGKTWRCWTSRPTYEKRKAVKWDDA